MQRPAMNTTTLARVALGYLALNTAFVGVWAQFAPRSFYDSFPGGGRVWVAVDGPFNEHLVRDVGGLNLALTVVLLAAAFTMLRPLVVVAGLGALAYGVPHVIYHLANNEPLSTTDTTASIGGLALFVVVAALVSVRAIRKPAETAERQR